MSLEAAIKELTEAVNKNTAAHEELVQVAVKTAGGKAAPAKTETKEAETDDDAEDAKKKAAAKKAAETRAANKAKAEEKKAEEKKAEEEGSGDVEIVTEIVTEIDAKALHTKAKTWMSSDDAEERDANKEKFQSALKHLGAAKLSDLEDTDRAKVATYINAWESGQDKIDFEALDAKVDGDDDDMLG